MEDRNMDKKAIDDIIAECTGGECIDLAFKNVSPLGTEYYACPFSEIAKIRCEPCEERTYDGHFGSKEIYYVCKKMEELDGR